MLVAFSQPGRRQSPFTPTCSGCNKLFEVAQGFRLLRNNEVVLTFDDGPWPENTPMVLKALQDNCIKATFFEIGEHASWHPEITKLAS